MNTLKRNETLKRNPMDLVRPSASHKWIPCHGSPFMEAQFEDSESEYAKEGTFAHLVAEKRLAGDDDQVLANVEYNEGVVSEEMDQAVQRYVDYVRDLPGELYVEHKIPFKDLELLPNNGTSDSVVVDWDSKKIYIIDLKYGKTKVDAENNTQMRLYAMGVLRDFEMLGDFDTVEMVIHQPRLDWVDGCTLKVKELVAWFEKTVEPALQRIPLVDETNVTAYLSAGPHCDKFCAAKAHCAIYAEYNVEAVAEDFMPFEGVDDFRISEPGQLSIEEVSYLLGRVAEIKKWCEAVKDGAVADLTAGKEIPGWKLVAGRGARQWVDEDATETLLKSMRSMQADAYAPRKMLTAPALETVMGKDKFAKKLGDHVVKVAGAPTLATESDKRLSLAAKNDFEFDEKPEV